MKLQFAFINDAAIVNIAAVAVVIVAVMNSVAVFDYSCTYQ